jgi:PTH2 family peptidyl-tRNA hydrolase
MSWDYKQVIVVRSDVKMSPAKIAVQVAHASVSAIHNMKDDAVYEKWFNGGQHQKKVVLRVDDYDCLMYLYQRCVDAGLPCALIRDAGRTEIEPGTVTCLGIGPSDEDSINKVTSHLSLYR